MIRKIFLVSVVASAAIVLAIVDTSREVTKAVEGAWKQL